MKGFIENFNINLEKFNENLNFLLLSASNSSTNLLRARIVSRKSLSAGQVINLGRPNRGGGGNTEIWGGGNCPPPRFAAGAGPEWKLHLPSEYWMYLLLLELLYNYRTWEYNFTFSRSWSRRHCGSDSSGRSRSRRRCGGDCSGRSRSRRRCGNCFRYRWQIHYTQNHCYLEYNS